MRKIKLRERVLALALAVVMIVGVVPANSLIAKAAENCNIIFQLEDEDKSPFSEEYAEIETIWIDGEDYIADVDFSQNEGVVTFKKDITLENVISYQLYAKGYGLAVSVGDYEVNPGEHAEDEIPTVTIDVKSFKAVAGQFTSAAVRGIVSDEDGAVEGIEVKCGEFETTTDKNGYYTFDKLNARETYTISIEASDKYKPAEVTVVTDEERKAGCDISLTTNTYTVKVTGARADLSKVLLDGEERTSITVKYGTKVAFEVENISERCKLVVGNEETFEGSYYRREKFEVTGDVTISLGYVTAASIDVDAVETTSDLDKWTNKDVTITGKVDGLDDGYKVQLLDAEDKNNVVVVDELSAEECKKNNNMFAFTVNKELVNKLYTLKVIDEKSTLFAEYDLEGNVKIDKIDPVIKEEISWNNAFIPVPDIVWANANTTFSLTVSDNEDGSGIASENTDYENVKVNKDGENVITISDDAGNTTTKTVTYNYDNDGPVYAENPLTITEKLNVIEQKESGTWFWNQKAKFEIDVKAPTDKGCGVATYYYKVMCGEDELSKGKLSEGDKITIGDDKSEKNATGKITVLLGAEDNLGNVTEEKEYASFIVDNTAPVITYSIDKTNIVINKIAQLLGLYTNANLKITVTAEDGDGIGFKESETIFTGLSYNNKTIEPITVEIDENDIAKATAVYEISLESDEGLWSPISVNASDALGNTHANAVVAQKSVLVGALGNDADLYIMVEDNKPEVKLAANLEPDYKEGDKEWYANKNVVFTYTIEDTDSGLYQIDCYINDDDLTGKLNVELPEKTKLGNTNTGLSDVTGRTDVAKEATVTLDLTAKDSNAETGECKVVLKVTDNAGNVKDVEKTIYFDVDAPKFSNVKFVDKYDKPAQVVEIKENDTVQSDYQYFFKENTTVEFNVTDYVGETENTGSGVNNATVKYTLKGIDKEGKTVDETEVAKLGDGNTYTFDVPEGYKVFLTLDASDMVGNATPTYHPDGVVLENKETHADKSTASIMLNKTTNYTDKDGLPLYPEAVNVSVNMKDLFAGIKNAKYASKVTSNGKENSKSFAGNLNETTGYSDKGGFAVLNDSNLVTSIGYSNIESYDGEQNGITLTFGGVCNAGHSISAEGKNFSVDTVAPRIKSVTWSSEAQVQNGKYYKADRVATIVIEERNWNECNIVTTGPVKPEVNWNHKGDTHTATVRFSKDGDYTFKFDVTDLAGHSSSYDEKDAFTIDKTKPVINVSYDNNNVENGSYYDAVRTATVTITEHNFRASDVKFETNGKISGWSSSGDKHTATVYFGSDNDYYFDVSYIDLAGNEADDYTRDEFTVDLTNPTVEITGVKDRSANKGTVAPVITIHDTNFKYNGVEYTLVGANKGKINISGMISVSRTSDGCVIRFNNFPEGMDDIYTLTATSVDMAGNKTTKEILYSVNRDGSTYKVNKYTKELIEKGYTNDPQDIVIEETNVDTLTFIELSYTKDGKIVVLEEGKDYKISTVGGENSWKKYTYTIFASAFEEEGKYNINIKSKDRAKNESNNKVQSMTVEFVVDKTVPTMAISNLEDRGRYDTETHQFIINVKDNALLSKVEIYMENENGELELVNTIEGEDLLVENGKLYIDVPSKEGYQKVKVVAYDEAGNATDPAEFEYSVLVTTNGWLLFYNNTPLFVGTIVGVLAVLGFIFFLIWKKRKKDEEAA